MEAEKLEWVLRRFELLTPMFFLSVVVSLISLSTKNYLATFLAGVFSGFFLCCFQNLVSELYSISNVKISKTNTDSEFMFQSTKETIVKTEDK